MTKKLFTKAVGGDALDTKAHELEEQLQQLGWWASLEVFRKLANEKEGLSEERKKLLLIDYLEVYLEWKTNHPDKGERYLIARVQEEMSEARVDKLTGIGNLRFFNETFATELAVLARMNNDPSLNANYVSAFMTFDVNGLKAVNDTLGHPAGDAFIKHFAKVVSEATRPGDVLFRVGGDEFNMIISGADAEDCKNIINNIRKALDKNPFVYEGVQITMKTGVGICIFNQNSDQIQVVADADEMLYEDKKVQPKSVMMPVRNGSPAGGDVNHRSSVL